MTQPDKALRREIKRATRRYSQSLLEIGNAYRQLFDANDYGAAVNGSLATVEDDFLIDMFGDGYQDPGGSVSHLALARLLVAVDCMSGTAHQLVPPDAGVYSVWATGRAMLEAAGRVVWLQDKTVDPVTRFARVLNDRLGSIAGAVRLVEVGKIEEKHIVNDPRDRMDHIVEQVEELGFEIKGKGSKRRIRGEDLPTKTDLVDDLVGPGKYSLFSGYSHHEVWAIGHQQEAVGVADPAGQGRSFSKAAITLQEYQELSRILAIGFVLAVESAIAYHGWTNTDRFKTVVDRAAGKIKKLL